VSALYWVTGQFRLLNVWEFVGVFSTEEKAVAACHNDCCFVAPAILDEQEPESPAEWEGLYYPLRQGCPDSTNSPDSPKVRSGVALIAEERARQIAQEGYTAEHDAKHGVTELARAGAAYALCATELNTPAQLLEVWPWDYCDLKPSGDGPLKDLVRAGALIAAAIDRQLKLEKGGGQ